MYGSDQAASLEPRGQIELVSVIKKMLLAKGKNMYGNITKEEQKISKKIKIAFAIKINFMFKKFI